MEGKESLDWRQLEEWLHENGTLDLYDQDAIDFFVSTFLAYWKAKYGRS